MGKKMFCQNCGNEINDNAAVCPKCGAAVEMQSTPVYSAYPAAETPNTNGAAGYEADVKKRPKMSKKKQWWQLFVQWQLW